MRWMCAFCLGLMFGAPLRADDDHPLRHMQAQEVAEGVYAILTPVRSLPDPQNHGWNSNSAFVVTDGGVLLFDSGSSTRIGETIRATIATVTDRPVRWIINSHAHGDHWLGNAAFAQTVQTVYSSSSVKQAIELSGETWVQRFNRMTEGATGDSRILPPNTVIDQRRELVLGNTRVIVFPSGNSHSPGDLLAWLPASKVLLSGDVVYADRMPSTNAADMQQWISLLDELQRLQPAVVIPGHGGLTDAQGLARLQALLKAYWQAVEQGYAAGKAPYEIVPDARAALSPFERDYPGLGAKLKRDLPHVYLQVEAATF